MMLARVSKEAGMASLASADLGNRLASIDLESKGKETKETVTIPQRKVPLAEPTFSPNTNSLLSGTPSGDEAEGVMRTCFGEAFDQEIEYLKSLSIPISKERKRQILADILVWAEVTQDHYDKSIRSFILEPNRYDESFLRVGRFLRESKQQHGLL